MSMFKPATAGNAFLKMGIFGEQGSGKTHSSALIAIGLAQHLKRLKMPQPPVMFLDTETGSDWLRALFEENKVELLVHKSRAFTDLKQAVIEADAAKAILIVDSISHFWEELQGAYEISKQKRTGNKNARLELMDWMPIKGQWKTFTTSFINSNAHIIICGRQASVYEMNVDEENNKKQMIAAGTRMAAEKGLGYESSLLVEMHSTQVGSKNRKTIVRVATVLKDRGRSLDGRQFKNPTFADFVPHVKQLNLGGTHVGIDITRNSNTLFPRSERDDRSLQRKIVLDEIESLLVLHYPGQTANEKKTKAKLIKTYFNASWTEISTLMPLEHLREGYDRMHQELEQASSRYHLAPPDEFTDEIPDDFLGKGLDHEPAA